MTEISNRTGSRGSVRSPIRFGLAGLWGLTAVLALAASMLAPTGNGIVIVALIVVVAALSSLALSHGPWSSTFLGALVLSVFHFGAFPSVLQGVDAGAAARVIFFGPGTGSPSLLLSVAGLSAYVAGALTFGRRSLIDAQPSNESQTGDRLGTIAAWGTVILIALWTYLALATTGINPLSISYEEFLVQAEGTAWIYQPLGLLFAWSAMCSGRTYRVVVFAFVVWGFLAFFIGLRGEVLFPLVAHVAVYAATKKMPKFRWIIPVVLATLMASSLARTVRNEGLSSYEFDIGDLGVAEALAELGFSQYVVEMVYRWHYVYGEPLYHGATYFAPVERLIGRAIGAPMVDGQFDFRLMNVEVFAREGAFGGSVIAEALHNFGLIGVPVVLGLWGLAISFFRSRVYSSGQRMLALEVLILFLFLWHVRNSFVPLPLQLGYAVVLVLLFTRGVGSGGSSKARKQSAVLR